MKTPILSLIMLSLAYTSSSYALTDIDQYLREKIDFFQIKAIAPMPKNPNTAQVELGKRLFMETEISGNRNVSCMSCHHPKAGTSDFLPLSRTEDGNGVLRRNSQSIFNLANHSFMFWDGRVHFDKSTGVFTTPEKNLPASITSVLTSALSAQALFPMVSMEEMKGKAGDNEIADAKNNLEAWDKIVLRLKNLTNENPARLTYTELFRQAYPETQIDKINIGHLAEAIGAFEKEQFQSTGSPFFRYLNGDLNALSDKQKRGFAVFVDAGKCIACHQGGELGNNSFFASVGVPQWGAVPLSADKGRAEVTGESFKKYFFRTPSLLNIAKTAPYMHNGAFQTLREVINHYSNIRESLNNYQISEIRRKTMPVEVGVLNDQQHLNEVWNSIEAPFLKHGLMLSEMQKDDLEAFLSKGLSDPNW
ncbi:MAG: cytochrome c peroxidase [Bacteriovorax sp.]|jgi:cytochrome c peroxidase